MSGESPEPSLLPVLRPLLTGDSVLPVTVPAMALVARCGVSPTGAELLRAVLADDRRYGWEGGWRALDSDARLRRHATDALAVGRERS